MGKRYVVQISVDGKTWDNCGEYDTVEATVQKKREIDHSPASIADTRVIERG